MTLERKTQRAFFVVVLFSEKKKAPHDLSPSQETPARKQEAKRTGIHYDIKKYRLHFSPTPTYTTH